VPASELPRGEVYGSEGTLSLPDPNTFGGPVKVKRLDEQKWSSKPLDRPFADESRGLGLADMVATIRGRDGRTTGHRASGQLALHVLDAMQAILESAEARSWRTLTTTCARPSPLPTEVLA
jgi:predicted dehydrogenase